MRSLRIVAATLAAGALVLAGCSSKADSDVVTLKVGASPSPHAEILNYVQENLATENGIKIEVVEYTDYVQPNEALNDGSLDANFFQTVPYLESESISRGFNFTAGEGVHLEPLAVYSNKITSLDELPEGGTIGIISDPSNQGRALALLAENGIVELPGTGEPNVNNVTKLKDFSFVEVEGPALANSLADVDAAVINGNFAQNADLAPADGIAIESVENNPAVNVLVWADGSDKAEAIRRLEELLHSSEVREFIKTTWPDGAVIPAY